MATPKELLIRRIVKDVRDTRPLTIVGSGMTASDPYCMPSMGELGASVSDGLRYLPTIDPAVVDRFDNLMHKVGYEAAFDQIAELLPFQSQVVDIVQSQIQVRDLSVYEMLLHDRPNTGLGRYLSELQQSSAPPAVVITTNYDRIIEYECGLRKIRCYTGFAGGYIGEYGDGRDPYRPDPARNRHGVDLYKVHGSLGWYADKNGDSWRLPLQRSAGRGFRSLMIIPGDKKFEQTHYGVYRALIALADAKIRAASSIVSIGYGFNDPHIHEPVKARVSQAIKPVPIVVLARSIGPACRSFLAQCKRYVVLSRDGNDTNFECDEFSGTECLPNSKYWSLDGFLELMNV